MHGFGSREEASGSVQLFLINKFEKPAKLRVALGSGAATASADMSITSMVDTADHWGTLTAAEPVACVAGVCELQLPALSFSRIASTP